MARNSPDLEWWINCGFYASIFVALMLIHLLPLRTDAWAFPGPDLFICITIAWVLRRPQFVPTPLVAVLFLVADIAFMRPLGLWTALVVVLVEVAKARVRDLRDLNFLAEWCLAAAMLLALTLANRIVLAALLVEQAELGQVLFQCLATILAYPVVVLATAVLAGITWMTAEEADVQSRAR